MHNIVLFKEASEGYEDHETVMLEWTYGNGL